MSDQVLGCAMTPYIMDIYKCRSKCWMNCTYFCLKSCQIWCLYYFELVSLYCFVIIMNHLQRKKNPNSCVDAILGTFQDNGGAMFWNIASKMPVQANPIVCWKFLQVIHKLMRDGHPNVSVTFFVVLHVFLQIISCSKTVTEMERKPLEYFFSKSDLFVFIIFFLKFFRLFPTLINTAASSETWESYG